MKQYRVQSFGVVFGDWESERNISKSVTLKLGMIHNVTGEEYRIFKKFTLTGTRDFLGALLDMAGAMGRMAKGKQPIGWEYE